jgi:hypothetical protein
MIAAEYVARVMAQVRFEQWVDEQRTKHFLLSCEQAITGGRSA